MGCSSSTATGALEPTQKCYDYRYLRNLCSGSRGSFGCFVTMDKLEPFRNIIINQYDIILHYPTDLTKILNPTDYELNRIKAGKDIKHTEIVLTDNSKKTFLAALSKSSITGLKIFFKRLSGSNRSTDNTFNRESLILREQMNNFLLTSKSTEEPPYNVKSLIFNPEIDVRYRNKLSRMGLSYDSLNAEYISFSIQIKDKDSIKDRQLERIDFIFLETCREGNLLKYRVKSQRDFNNFIKSTIINLHTLHNQNIYHSDVKPGNILNCSGKYKLIDYGLSVKLSVKKDAREYIINKLKKLQGTILYTNPMYVIITLKYGDIVIISKVINHYKEAFAYMKLIYPSISVTLDPVKLVYGFLNSSDVYKDYIDTFTDKEGRTYNGFYVADYYDHFIPSLSPDRLIEHARALYSRADWFSLALTIYEVALINNIPITDKLLNGIYTLTSITDDKILEDDLDKFLIHSFGLRTSVSVFSGGISSNSYKH